MTKPTQTSQQSARQAPRRFRGFTLIELMVSISIMSIIMLAFGGLMTRTNIVVTQGEKRMRADAAASAISRLIRNDIRKMTKNGFLRMSPDKLMFVIAGKTQSAFSEQSGDGAIIVYGRDEDSNVLYRKILVLAKKAPTTEGNKVVDCLLWDKDNAGTKKALDLAELQVMGTEKMTQIMDQVVAEIEKDDLAYPPRRLSQLEGTMWMVLAGGCKELKITSRSTKKNEWKEGGGTHTRHNQSSWPAALKFKFKLSSDSLVGSAIAEAGNTSGDVEYEIICPIGH